MKKLIKIISLTLILLLFCIGSINAVDLNLTENTSYEVDENINEATNVVDNDDTNTTNDTYSNSSYSSNSTTNSVSDYTNANVDITIPSATVKTGSVSDSSLNLSNILNIFLIVVGILIILLAIAILLKLKN